MNVSVGCAEYRAANLYLQQIRRIVSLVAPQRPGRLFRGRSLLAPVVSQDYKMFFFLEPPDPKAASSWLLTARGIQKVFYLV